MISATEADPAPLPEILMRLPRSSEDGTDASGPASEPIYT
jgi:hypothetical protein